MNKKITILSTRQLPNNIKSLLDKNVFNYVEYNFIEIQPLPFKKDELLQKNNWIITSKNALKIILNTYSISELKSINFYCVGQQTSHLIVENKLKLIEWANYSENLAHKIIKHHSQKHFFFIGGEMRRYELPSLLKNQNVSFEMINVYTTVLSPNEINQIVDGLLFFSPSAVNSYVINNSIKNEDLFCIGNTTAKEAKKYSRQIFIPKEQTFKSVIDLVNNHYK